MSRPAARPEHPDFRLIAQALAGMDAMADSGQLARDITGRHLDPDSVTYAAVQRAARARAAGVPGGTGQLSAIWTDGFIAGMIVQYLKTRTGHEEAAAGERDLNE